MSLDGFTGRKIFCNGRPMASIWKAVETTTFVCTIFKIFTDFIRCFALLACALNPRENFRIVVMETVAVFIPCRATIPVVGVIADQLPIPAKGLNRVA